MKKGLALEKIGVLTLVLIMTAVGLQIISGLREDASEKQVKLEKFYPDMDYPYCAEFEPGQEVSKEELFKITYYRLRGSCDLPEQELTADFTLRKDELEGKAREWSLTDADGDLMMFYRDSCESARELELTGLTLGMNSEFIYSPGDSIKISGTGRSVILC